MYTAAAAAANSPSMSSSIASLRLKAKQYDDIQQQSPSSYSSIPSLTSNENKTGSNGDGDTPDPPSAQDAVGSTSLQCQYSSGLSTGGDKNNTAAQSALVGGQ